MFGKITKGILRVLSIKRRWFRHVIKIVWVTFFVCVFGIPLYIYAVIKNPYNLFGGMPSFRQVENPENDLSSEVFTADGVSLGRYFTYNRSNVRFEELSPFLVSTLIISEDHRFHDHSGMDLWSYARVLKGILTFDNEGGGSTLSQQTAKNLFQTRGDELKGRLAAWGSPIELVISKTKEWIIAVNLEKNFTKQEILTLYLNTVPFNNNAYGIKTASETYFGKAPSKLNLQESALLVGMLQGTHLFNPVRYPERALRKRNQVLAKLYAHKYIKTSTILDSLTALPLQLNFSIQDHNAGLAPYFRTAVQNELRAWAKEYGYDLFESGLKIYTTIDSRMQKMAEEAVSSHLRELQKNFESEWGRENPWRDRNGREMKGFLDQKITRTELYRQLVKKHGDNIDSINYYLNAKKRMRIFTWEGSVDTMFSAVDSLRYYNRFLQAGLVSIDPRSGAVKAWVGGVDHRYFQFDHVVQAKRQPGSTFKPFVYGRAMEDGYSPCELFYDVSKPIDLNGSIYRVTNFDGTHGSGKPFTLRQAIARSLNTIAIQLMDELKPSNVTSFAKRMGITSDLVAVHALALGTSDVSLMEMVSAYSTFVNKGVYTAPFYITRIEDKHGNVIKTFTPLSKQGTDEVTAYKIVHLLKGGVEEEGGTSAMLSKAVLENNEVGGKTGTTNNASDGWYIGITPNLVTGVWVGGDEPSIHFRNWALGSGTRTALPIWDKFMTKVYQRPEVGYPKGTFEVPEGLDITLDCSKYPTNDGDLKMINN